jgi:hypothetical protein
MTVRCSGRKKMSTLSPMASAASVAAGASTATSPITIVRLKAEQIQLVADFLFFECAHHFGKSLRHRHFLEKGDGENLQQCVEGGFQGETLLDDGDGT